MDGEGVPCFSDHTLPSFEVLDEEERWRRRSGHEAEQYKSFSGSFLRPTKPSSEVLDEAERMRRDGGG